MLSLLVLLAGLLAVQGQTTNVQRCSGRGRNAPLPINAYVEGCVDPPCPLPRGSFATVHLVFRAPRKLMRMTTHAQAFVVIVPINYPLGEFAETCNFLSNSFCPVMEDEVLQYTLQMQIETGFPVEVSVTVEFRIEDEANESILCIRVPITVVPPVSA
ncbi:hypothetical protein ABMA28_008933 [Loxostege sticticalis]|uniref:MD-2-related lipid-recognition domain-containing protein n=1 Tax=Loxostege sticticalis TaxID=481309 RepID=A0ABD0SF75_LOXSC